MSNFIDRVFGDLHRAFVARQNHAVASAISAALPVADRRAESRNAATFACPQCGAAVSEPPAPPSGARFGSLICLPNGHLFLTEPTFTDDYATGRETLTFRVQQDTVLVPRTESAAA